MADEKKPKIDLKARLGKTAVGGAQVVPTPGQSSAPMLGGRTSGVGRPTWTGVVLFIQNLMPSRVLASKVCLESPT